MQRIFSWAFIFFFVVSGTAGGSPMYCHKMDTEKSDAVMAEHDHHNMMHKLSPDGAAAQDDAAHPCGTQCDCPSGHCHGQSFALLPSLIVPTFLGASNILSTGLDALNALRLLPFKPPIFA